MSDPHVLHVDDDPRITERATARLESDLGAAVTVATTVADGLEQFAAGDVDCIVSGYGLPDRTGLEFLRRVRELDGRVPFVLYTEEGSESVASDAIAADVTEYLPKNDAANCHLLVERVGNAIENHRTETRFEGFLEVIPDAICIIDEDGRITTVNRQLESLFGYAADDLLGEKIEMLLPERDRDIHVHHREAYMADPVRRPMGISLDLFGLHRDGTEFPVDISLSPMRIGGQVEVMAAVRDVTERRRRENRLERQNERLEEFVSIVSHDLRNPLNVATGNLELARELDGAESDYLDAVERSHHRMKRLIEDSLTLARQGDFVGEAEPRAVAAVARRAWRNVDVCESDLVVEDGTGQVMADEGRLLQLFENLFRNAVEHGGASVTVRVGPLDGDAGFFVADDGPGIPEEERENVLESGYTTAEDGTGFGLAIVRRIAEAHGWEVGVATGRDGGARFEILIPRAGELLYAD